MSKSKAPAPPKKCSKPCCTEKDSWVLILKDFASEKESVTEVSGGEGGAASGEVVKLRHPRFGTPALFLLSPGNLAVRELLVHQDDKPRSFFIDSEVKSDGRFLLATPMDPLFLALPYLKNYEKCSPLDHILTDAEFPATARLLDCPTLTNQLHRIAERRGDASLQAFQYSQERCLQWLEKKTRRLSSVLKERGVRVASNNLISLNFNIVKESTLTPEEENGYLRYALGLISDYLPESVSVALQEHLGLQLAPPSETTAAVDKKRKSTGLPPAENGTTGSHLAKKPKLDEGSSVNETSPSLPSLKEKKATPSAKAKAMAKAASGSKNIMSFFKKK